MRFINIMYYVGKVFQATIEIIKLDIGFIYIIYNDFNFLVIIKISLSRVRQ